MPPRPAKKTPAKKPSPRANKTAPTSDSSEVDALPSVAEETASLAVVVGGDTLAQAEGPSSSAVVEEDGTAKDAESTVEPELPADPIVEDSNIQPEPEELSADKGEDLVDKEDQPESEEALEDQEADVHDVGEEVAGLEVDGEDVDDVDDKDDGTSVDADNEDNDDTLSVQAALAEGRKQKESVIFVGGLDKEAVEDDLLAVFGVFGDVQSARIVRHPTTKKSKGFAFIHFADSEHATKALTELKDGTEIKGKRVRIQASQDNAKLYLGNICKIWTKDNVIERLKNLGIEQFDNMILPVDPKNEEKIKGFAFLEFSSHSDAMLAFQRLRKPDADFGRESAAKVAFSYSLHPNEDDMLEVKTVYVEGIPLSWEEEKIKEICKEYGQIEKVQLSRNFGSSKRKDFGFVEFSSRESALACVEGINKAKIVDGDTNVTANLARPLSKGRLVKQGTKGGFMAKKDGETIHETGGIETKRKAKSMGKKPIKRDLKRGMPSTSQFKGKSGQAMPIKRKKDSGSDMNADANHHPSKKMRPNHNNGKAYVKGVGSRMGSHSGIRKTRYGARTPGYPATSYRRYAYPEVSESQIRPSDLVPHAGYLPSVNQVRNNYDYSQRRSEIYNSDLRSSFGSGRAMSGVPSSYYYPQTDYYNYQLAGHRHPSSGAYAPRGPPYY